MERKEGAVQMSQRSLSEPSRQVPVVSEADVLVAGGGQAGVAAAVAAARQGARTILVERNSYLGGVFTAGLMSSITNVLYLGTGERIVNGIIREIIDRLVKKGGASRNWGSAVMPQIPVDVELAKLVLTEMILEAGVEVWLDTWVSDVVMDGANIAGVIVESKSGRQALAACTYVDATGDADLAARAGAPLHRVAKGSDTLMFRMANVDLERLAAYFESHPEEWQPTVDISTSLEDFLRNWREYGVFHLPHGGGRHYRLVQKRVQAGEFATAHGIVKSMDVLGLFAVSGEGIAGSGTVLVNSQGVSIDSLDVRQLSQALLECRQCVFLVADFLRKYVPGFENAYVVQSADNLGVRYTRWIEGEYTLTLKEFQRGPHFADTVGWVPVLKETFTDRTPPPFMPYGYEMPYRVMVPKQVDNLLVASGKSVSTMPRGLARGQVECSVLGQAAGVAAALSAQTGTSVRNLDIRVLQRSLLKQGVNVAAPERLHELGLP